MKIVVPLDIDRDDVINLVMALETTDNEDLKVFITKVLRKTHEVTSQYKKETDAIRSVNPFSMFD